MAHEHDGAHEGKKENRVDAFFVIALLAQAGLAVLFGVFTEYGPDFHDATTTDVAKNMAFYVDVTRYLTGIGRGRVFAFGVLGSPRGMHYMQRSCESERAGLGLSWAWQLLRSEAHLADARVRVAVCARVCSMIFLGFGFLMTFMWKHSYGAIVYVFLVSVFCVQWAILALGFCHRVVSGYWATKIALKIHNLIHGQFAAGSVMIALGGVIGKVPHSLNPTGFALFGVSDDVALIDGTSPISPILHIL